MGIKNEMFKILCLTFMLLPIVRGANTLKFKDVIAKNQGVQYIDHCVGRISGIEPRKETKESSYYASIGFKKTGSGGGPAWIPLCGGALVTPTYVVTAARCFFDPNGVKYKKDDMKIYSGTLKITEKGTEQGVKEAWIHKNFVTTSILNDLAVAEASGGFSAILVKMPTAAKDITNDNQQFCLVTGFGTMPDIRGRLSSVCVNLVPRVDCLFVYGYVDDKQLCAGTQTMDAVYPEFGSPIVCKGWLVGVMSSSTKPYGAFPAVYTRVSRFEDAVLVKLEDAHADMMKPSVILMTIVLLALGKNHFAL